MLSELSRNFRPSDLWLVGWLDGWLIGWLVGWLAGWRKPALAAHYKRSTHCLATHHEETMFDCRSCYQRGPATLQPIPACRYNSVVLWPVPAAHLSGTSSLTADQMKHREPLHYTVANCPLLHHRTPAPSRPALYSMVVEPAANQQSQQAHPCHSAKLLHHRHAPVITAFCRNH